MSKRFRNGLIVMLGFLGLPLLLFMQRMAVYDWARLRNYQPSPLISGLADRTTMSSSSRRLFYVYHPEVQEKSDFNVSCREDEQTIVLGCYVSGRGIYLLDIMDARLDGVEEVTAAHEMLHAAYERLSSKERARVDRLLKNALAAVTDQRILDTVELYKKQDTTKIENELHSILGTEVRNLPPELEAYYARYFSDRSKVVGYSEQYERAFTERKDQVAAYDAELASLKTEIDKSESSLETMQASLSAQRATLEGQRRAGNIDAYNAGVASFNRKVTEYNGLIDTITAQIARYNDIVAKRNALANEEQELVKAIDSRETVPEKQ